MKPVEKLRNLPGCNYLQKERLSGADDPRNRHAILRTMACTGTKCPLNENYLPPPLDTRHNRTAQSVSDHFLCPLPRVICILLRSPWLLWQGLCNTYFQLKAVLLCWLVLVTDQRHVCGDGLTGWCKALLKLCPVSTYPHTQHLPVRLARWTLPQTLSLRPPSQTENQKCKKFLRTSTRWLHVKAPRTPHHVIVLSSRGGVLVFGEGLVGWLVGWSGGAWRGEGGCPHHNDDIAMVPAYSLTPPKNRHLHSHQQEPPHLNRVFSDQLHGRNRGFSPFSCTLMAPYFNAFRSTSSKSSSWPTSACEKKSCFSLWRQSVFFCAHEGKQLGRWCGMSTPHNLILVHLLWWR